MSTQLGLDGVETPYPPRTPRRLSDRQRELVAYIGERELVTPTEVGVLMHQGRERRCVVLLDFRRGRVGCCRFASSDGCDALRRLAKRGLVERVSRGKWRLIRHDEAWT
jgi:hypothetical protein